MKRLSHFWPLVISVAAFYSIIMTPLQLIEFDSFKSFLPFDFVVSFIFLSDFIRNLRLKHLAATENGHFHKTPIAVSTIIQLVAALPYELLFLLPGPSQVFTLVKILRAQALYNAYCEIKIDVVNFRRYRLPLIFIGVVMGIHLVACSWLALNPMPHLPIKEAYIRSLYWSVTTLTTTGYGDITPTNDAGRLFTIFIMMLGFSAFGIIVGNVSNILMAKNRLAEANKEKMEDLSIFMQHYDVPLVLQGDVFKFYHQKMNKRLSENDSLIVADLPHALQNELFVYMKIKLISNLPVFSGLSKQCLSKISHACEQVSFGADETIINKGEFGDEMYIIEHGEVFVLNEADQALAVLKHGQCFGEIALLMEVTRTAKVMASNYCDAYRLKKKDFLEICRLHPELEFNFRRIIRKRMQDEKAA